MPRIVLPVHVNAGGGQAGVAERVAHVAQVDVIGEIGANRVAQPVRRCRSEPVGLFLPVASMNPTFGGGFEDHLDHAVDGAARHGLGPVQRWVGGAAPGHRED